MTLFEERFAEARSALNALGSSEARARTAYVELREARAVFLAATRVTEHHYP